MPVVSRSYFLWWHGSVGRAHRSHRWGAEPKRRQWRNKRGVSVVSNKSCKRQRSRTPIANLTERAKRSETVGSSPTVTTTNPVGVQVQRLPDFFAYSSRVRTFRSQEYALFCQRGTQKGYAVHLKTAYPWKHFVHIHRDALANFRFFHQKHKQLTSSFSFEFRMPNRKKFQKIINTHLVAVL